MAERLKIVGPPGTGKTTESINLVKGWLADGVEPQAIGYSTFTKNAAQEALTRALDQTDSPSGDLEWFKTLHATAFRLLRLNSRTQVADNIRLDGFMQSERIPFNRYSTEDDLAEGSKTLRSGNYMANLWNKGRNQMCKTAEDAWESADDQTRQNVTRKNFLHFVARMEEWKRQHGLFDFTDMLASALKRNLRTGCTHLVVDEAQDLTPLMWAFVHHLEQDAEMLVCAGDDDQGIMAFSGAVPERFVELDAVEKMLSQSYRVFPKSHAVAQELIECIPHRIPKLYLPRPYEGAFTRWNRMHSMTLETMKTSAFLHRNGSSLKTMGDEWMEAALPFASNRYKCPLSNPVLVRGLRALLRWRADGEVSLDEALAVHALLESTPDKGARWVYGSAKRNLAREAESRPFAQVSDIGLTEDGKAQCFSDPIKMVKDCKGLKDREGNVSRYLTALIERYGESVLWEDPRLYLTTVHGSKGNEWDHVYISTDALPAAQDGVAADKVTETRCKYVAVTRAKESVTILPPQQTGGWTI